MNSFCIGINNLDMYEYATQKVRKNEEKFFNELNEPIKEERYWEQHGHEWSYTPPRRSKKGR